MELYEYLFKFVNVVDIYGRHYDNWYCDDHGFPDDNDNGEESIGIVPNAKAKSGVDLSISEIKSIELV